MKLLRPIGIEEIPALIKRVAREYEQKCASEGKTVEVPEEILHSANTNATVIAEVVGMGELMGGMTDEDFAAIARALYLTIDNPKRRDSDKLPDILMVRFCELAMQECIGPENAESDLFRQVRLDVASSQGWSIEEKPLQELSFAAALDALEIRGLNDRGDFAAESRAETIARQRGGIAGTPAAQRVESRAPWSILKE